MNLIFALFFSALKGTVVGEQVYTFDGVRYTLKKKLADGGFGSVFLAKDDAVCSFSASTFFPDAINLGH
jgi:hypothetical protein